MKVELVSRKLVRPSIPTPGHLKSYKISYLDDLIPPINFGIPLFYSRKPERMTELEESLSKTLVGFYPLAGRYVKKDRAVDCSDEGVEFIRAEAPDIELKDLMAERNVRKLNQDFLPLPIYQDGGDEAAHPVASFQVTDLKCGGVVLGISISHKLLDTSSIKTFIDAWADANRQGGMTVTPNFYSPLLFPCKGEIAEEELGYDPDIVVHRFSFKKEAIMRLRSRLSNPSPVSRVRVVCAFISLALIRADRAKHGRFRPCMITQPVNMRDRTIPPMPKHSCGNLVSVSSARCIPADDIGMQQLVDLISGAVEKSSVDFSGMFSPCKDRYKIIKEPLDDFLAACVGGEVNVMWFSDWTKFGFYEADFGWGKPDRVSCGPFAAEKMTMFLDNKEGGGVDALVHLNKDDMAVFEQDVQIKSFAAY